MKNEVSEENTRLNMCKERERERERAIKCRYD
jgi:hypothetical protein